MMDEKVSYLRDKAAKYSLGKHRGPLPEPGTDGADLEHIETTDTITLEKIKRSPTQKLRRHWARFWCCYLFWNIIFLAIFLPIFFLVIIPAIAQNVVDRSSLVLTEASVMQPRPHSMVLSLKSALKLPLALPARIEPIALELFNRKEPMNNTWAKAYLPPAVIDGNTTLGIDNQATPLDDAMWMQYVHNVVFEPHAILSVRGSTNSYLGKLKSHVTLNKDIHQNTLNKFAGFSITDSTLLLPPKPDGTNLVANATLPNPSVLTLEIGKTVLDVKSGDIVLGNATIDHLVLRPGNHSNPVHGILDLSILFQNIGPILRDQAEHLANGQLLLTTIGKNVTYEGVEVPYYSKVLKQFQLSAPVPIGGLLSNTLRGLLNKNGTNILANATDSSSNSSSTATDAGESIPSLASNLEDDLSKNGGDSSGGSGGGLLSSLLNKRSGVEELAGHLEKRSEDELMEAYRMFS